MPMAIFRSAGKRILRERRNGSAETNERYDAGQCQFGTNSIDIGRVIKSRFGNDSFRTRIHACNLLQQRRFPAVR